METWQIKKISVTLYFLQELEKLDPRLSVLKIFMIFRVYCSLFVLFLFYF